MEFSSVFTFEEDDVPTFVQYIKHHGHVITGQLSLVKKIWFPNKYPNYQFITEKYKLSVRVTPKNEEQLADLVHYYVNNCLTMAIEVTDVTTKGYRILELPSEVVIWEPMSDYGWRCELQEKPTQEKTKRTTKK